MKDKIKNSKESKKRRKKRMKKIFICEIMK